MYAPSAKYGRITEKVAFVGLATATNAAAPAFCGPTESSIDPVAGLPSNSDDTKATVIGVPAKTGDAGVTLVMNTVGGRGGATRKLGEYAFAQPLPTGPHSSTTSGVGRGRQQQ